MSVRSLFALISENVHISGVSMEFNILLLLSPNLLGLSDIPDSVVCSNGQRAGRFAISALILYSESFVRLNAFSGWVRCLCFCRIQSMCTDRQWKGLLM